MQDFMYYNPTRTVFGRNSLARTGSLVAQEGAHKILLVYGSGSIKKNGVFDTVVASLREQKIDFVELDGIVPNPRLSRVMDGIDIVRQHNLDFILAVGGGSVIDSAKAIAFGCLLGAGEDIWRDYYMGGKDITASLPVGTVLTIPAAGSESSTSSVLTNEVDGHKRSVNGDLIRPRFAVMDPQTNFTLPPYQTACGVSDIVAHLMERYFTRVEHVDFTDRLIEASIATVVDNSYLVMADPEDYNARAEIMWAGSIAHNNLLETGRIGDWASHNIEHELSGKYDIAHGAGLSIIFPAWMRYVWKEDPQRFIQFATRVWGVRLPLTSPEAVVMAGIQKLEKWYTDMGLPTRLHHVEIDDRHFKEMAGMAMVGRTQNGQFKALKATDIEAIYRLAL